MPISITIPEREIYDPATNMFHQIKGYRITIEHSLVAISKWEAKWKKPFCSDKPRTMEETRDYVRCMTITQNIPADAYLALTKEHLAVIQAYIDDPMTATTFSHEDPGKKKPPEQFVTSELIYYWMTKAGISWEAERWHLNRLFTLLHIFSSKEAPPKKMTRQERRASMEARRAKYRKPKPHK